MRKTLSLILVTAILLASAVVSGIAGLAAVEVSEQGVTLVTALPTDRGANLIGGMLPVSIINNKGVAEDTTVTNAEKLPLRDWTNNNYNEYAYKYRMGNANKIYSGGSTAQGMRIAYDLGGSFDLDAVLLWSGYNANSPAQKSWMIYTADSLAELYSDENARVLAVNSQELEYNGNTCKTGQLLEFASTVTGRYIGLEMIETTGSGAAFITEIAAYGKPADLQIEYPTTLPSDRKNRLFGQYPYSVTDNTGAAIADTTVSTAGQKQSTLSFTNDNGTVPQPDSFATPGGEYLANFQMGSANMLWNGGSAKQGMRITYDMGNTYLIDQVLMNSGWSAASTAEKRWRVYGSEKFEDLYNPENCRVYVLDDSGAYGTKIQLVTLPEAAVCRYIGFELLESASTGPVASIGELAAYGQPLWQTDATVSSLTAPGDNVLAGGQLSYYAVENNASEKTATTNSPDLLFDNDITVGDTGKLVKITDFFGTSNNYVGRIIVEAPEQVTVGSMMLVMHTNGNSKFGFSYKAYVSDDKETLFNSENLFAVCDNTDGSKDKNLVIVNEDNYKTGKYFGIVPLNNHLMMSGNDKRLMYLWELAFYAAPEASVSNPTSIVGINLLKDQPLYAARGDKQSDPPGLVSSTKTMLTDGNLVGTSKGFDKPNNARFAYDMTAVSGNEIQAVLLAVDPTKTSKINAYGVFTADSLDDLFNLENQIALYGNDGANVIRIDFKQQLKSWFGVYIYNADADTSDGYDKIYFTEFAALSSTYKPNYEGDIKEPVAVYADGVKQENADSISAELLAGKHSLVLYDAGGNTNVYFLTNGVFDYREELNNAFRFVKTEIRPEAPIGMRFVYAASKNAREAADAYGMLVAKSAALKSNDLVQGATFCVVADAVAYAEGKTDIVYAAEENETLFSAALHNFDQRMYLTRYTARPYLTVGDFTIYGEARELQPSEVASAANKGDYSTEVQDLIEDILDHSTLADVTAAYNEAIGLTDEELAASLVTYDEANSQDTDENGYLTYEETTTKSVDYTEFDNTRVAKLISEIKAGTKTELTIGVLGGSITAGAAISAEDREKGLNYAGRLREWFENTYHIPVKLVNAGIGSTTSLVGVHRIEADLLQYEPDLVVLEYAVNDSPVGAGYINGTEGGSGPDWYKKRYNLWNDAYEACVYRILNAANKPALILLFTGRDETKGHDNADLEARIGQHYGVPMVSYRDAIVNTRTWSEVGADDVHPNYYGHQLIAALLTNYLAKIDANAETEAAKAGKEVSGWLYNDIYKNAKLYTSANIPAEWIESLGGFNTGSYYRTSSGGKVLFDYFPDGWYYDGTNDAAPLVFNVPGAKRVMMLVVRYANVANVGSPVKVESAAGANLGTFNVLNYLNTSSYADHSSYVDVPDGGAVKVTLTPAAGVECVTILGLMIAE